MITDLSIRNLKKIMAEAEQLEFSATSHSLPDEFSGNLLLLLLCEAVKEIDRLKVRISNECREGDFARDALDIVDDQYFILSSLAEKVVLLVFELIEDKKGKRR